MKSILDSLKGLQMQVANIQDELIYQIKQLEEIVAVQEKGCLTKEELAHFLEGASHKRKFIFHWLHSESHPELCFEIGSVFDLKFVEEEVRSRFIRNNITTAQVEIEALHHDMYDKELRFIFEHGEFKIEQEVKNLVQTIEELVSEFGSN